MKVLALVLVLVTLASAEEQLVEKKQEKRGLYGASTFDYNNGYAYNTPSYAFNTPGYSAYTQQPGYNTYTQTAYSGLNDNLGYDNYGGYNNAYNSRYNGGYSTGYSTGWRPSAGVGAFGSQYYNNNYNRPSIEYTYGAGINSNGNAAYTYPASNGYNNAYNGYNGYGSNGYNGYSGNGYNYNNGYNNGYTGNNGYGRYSAYPSVLGLSNGYSTNGLSTNGYSSYRNFY